jgi:hypothetical protein
MSAGGFGSYDGFARPAIRDVSQVPIYALKPAQGPAPRQYLSPE